MITCHYCDQRAQLVGGEAIYPHRPDLFDKKFYLCTPCNAYVGCHAGTANPLGILAKPELRVFKSRVHALFDPYWRDQSMRRSQAYQWLATGLRIPTAECHIGMFDEARCLAALAFLNSQSTKESRPCETLSGGERQKTGRRRA
jgi:hypothetical protein